ncbi:hypothetical protein CAEBREN_01662 [Caenorhabditis brenneri]|uniref:G-protein coupled receptors family 1 profile domain-containing protein n=1 Tax=Caenorhabditis brenneri TaxID=135651 RepID=G0P0I6_CAEBE|nr:hypothetical protein CAEBREN_01662 [Caenorhabditis brenneri]
MSSIISVMIGIGICDIASMLLAISMKHLIYNFYRDECTPPFSLFAYRLFWILMHLRDDFIRCSTWLGVIMASIRFMALRFVSKASFKRVTYLSFGFFATLIIFMISSIISILNSNRTKIIETGTWTAGASCKARSNETWILHELRVSDMFAANNGLLLRIVVFINAILSRILPCILLPILTLALILEVRRARKTMITSSFSVRKRTERTTALVIFMAGTFFIASLPAGVFSLFQVMYTDVGFLHLSTFVDHFCNAILTANASIHCVICFTMSSDYRNTVKEILRIRSKNFNSNSVFLGVSTVNISRVQ